ncbi:MAG: S8 family serine peptidase [Bdellovibrionaceae bacterium]|jgi:subtilisin family serine protease|nr:S8 family serine peptidase [Pseudobdellovibrionaceae bacterium]
MLRRLLAILGLGSSLLLLFNNCGQGFKALSADEWSSFGGVGMSGAQVAADPWPEVICPSPNMYKLSATSEEVAGSISEDTLRIASDLRAAWLDESHNLMVTVDNQCIKTQGAQSWLTEELIVLTPDAQFTTYRYPLYEPIWSEEIVRDASNDPCIRGVDFDADLKLFQGAPVDPRYSEQRYLASVGHAQAFGSVYNPYNGINQEVRVAVIDSGVDINHPDLRDMIARENGQVLALNGITNSSDVADSGFHGTHVAGIIAAQANNNEGISGTAGKFVKLLPVRASNDGASIALSAVTNGIRWAADRGAKVINLSLGGEQRRIEWLDAIRYAGEKGVLVVAAAGNDGRQISSQQTTYPAMFTAEVSNMLSVGSFDAATGGRSSFSNYSAQFVDIFAPGSDGTTGILSTVPTNLSASGYGSRVQTSQGARPINGTSMAAPVVSGAAALIYALAQSRGFQITPEQVKIFFERGSDINPSFNSLAKGGKVLNLKKLVDAVADDTGLSLSSTKDRSEAAGRVEIAHHSRAIGLPSGSRLELSVEKSSDSALLIKYQWYKDGRPIPGANSAELKKNEITVEDKGIYTAELSSGKTLRRTASIKVNVKDCPP